MPTEHLTPAEIRELQELNLLPFWSKRRQNLEEQIQECLKEIMQSVERIREIARTI